MGADWASIKFLADGEEHTTMRLSKADQQRFDVMGCCFRKPVNCPKVSSGSKSCTVLSSLYGDRRHASASRKRGPDQMQSVDIEALVSARAADQKCSRWAKGWCNRTESHGGFIHGTPEQSKGISCRSANDPKWVCPHGTECMFAGHVQRPASQDAQK